MLILYIMNYLVLLSLNQFLGKVNTDITSTLITNTGIKHDKDLYNNISYEITTTEKLPDKFTILSSVVNNDLAVQISGNSETSIDECNISLTISAFNTIDDNKIQIIEPITSSFCITIKRRI